jgi:hypothetical protein
MEINLNNRSKKIEPKPKIISIFGSHCKFYKVNTGASI